MKFFIPGIIIGSLAALFLFYPVTGIEIYPEWRGALSKIDKIQPSPDKSLKRDAFFVKINQDGYSLHGDGSPGPINKVPDSLSAFSGNGHYYVIYQKVGKTIELYNNKGDRFWKIDSLEYPHLSNNARLIFLIQGDQSRARIIDYNGNEIGVKHISGRTSTALAFSDQHDFGAIGFLDGTYYFVNESGKVIAKGAAPSGSMVKGIAVSSNGLYGAVHYGNTDEDFLRVLDISEGKARLVPLKNVHYCKTALTVTPNGHSLILDTDTIICLTKSGSMEFMIKLAPAKNGASWIGCRGRLCSASYTTKGGASKLLIFKTDGTILLSREYPAESFLKSTLTEKLILVRGSDNLYCYSIHPPDSE